MVFEAPIHESPLIRRVVGAGLLVTALLGLLVLASIINNIFPIRTNLALLAPLIACWLAARFTVFLSDRSRLRVWIPTPVRSILRWYVIAMSAIMGGVLMIIVFFASSGFTVWNLWKDNDGEEVTADSEPDEPR